MTGFDGQSPDQTSQNAGRDFKTEGPSSISLGTLEGYLSLGRRV